MQKLASWFTKQGIWILLAVMVILGAVLSPVFLTWNNIFIVLRQAAALSFVSIGQTFATIANCIDLSVGTMITLVQCIAAKTMSGDIRGLAPTLLYTFFVVLAVGLFNGFLIAQRKAIAFIVTLGTFILLEGVTLLYTNVQPVGSVPSVFRLLAEGYIGPIPFPVIMMVMFVIGGHFLLRRTRYGRYVLAVGGNEEVSRLAGIPVVKIIFLTCLLSASGAAFTGLFLAARMNIGDPIAGQTFSLDSIAAVVIGGTSIAGGRGSVMGTLGGVLIYSVLSNLMNLINVSPYYQIVVKGIVIVVAVVIYQIRRTEWYTSTNNLRRMFSRLFSIRA
jgi:ribose/xylose/arabinose/galactoside ABC-type transport system permease subunit